MPATPELTEVEMKEILKGIARTSKSAIARIRAIQLLKTWQDEEPAQNDAFAEIYEIANRR